MSERTTREALLFEGAMLFARHGIAGVTARQLHDAIGARNESALHYHFGDREGLVAQILLTHMAEIEARRAPLVAAIEADGRTGDLRSLVHGLAAPMATDLETPIGRAHLRVVAQLSPAGLAYERPFRATDTPAGRALSHWLRTALSDLPTLVRAERLAALRGQLICLFGLRAELIDDLPLRKGRPAHGSDELFLANLLDIVVAGLAAPLSPETTAVAGD